MDFLNILGYSFMKKVDEDKFFPLIKILLITTCAAVILLKDIAMLLILVSLFFLLGVFLNQKKFEKYGIQTEAITDTTNISEVSEEGKRKIYDFIELVKTAERARNNRETVNITNLSTENKEKAREYIELLEIKQEQK